MVSRFYHFSTIFNRFPKSFGKKEKDQIVLGRFWPRRPRSRAKRARAGNFTGKASGFSLSANGFSHCLIESLTLCKKVPRVLFLYVSRSPTAWSTAELRRAVCAGRLGQGLVPSFGLNQIRDPGRIFPNIIARMATY